MTKDVSNDFPHPLPGELPEDWFDRLRADAIDKILSIPKGSVNFSGCTSIEEVAVVVKKALEKVLGEHPGSFELVDGELKWVEKE